MIVTLPSKKRVSDFRASAFLYDRGRCYMEASGTVLDPFGSTAFLSPKSPEKRAFYGAHPQECGAVGSCRSPAGGNASQSDRLRLYASETQKAHADICSLPQGSQIA